MVALDFPDAPTVGQVFDKWTWNGTQWVLTSTGVKSGAWSATGGAGGASSTEVGAVQLVVPAQPVAGRLQIGGHLYVVKTAAADVFVTRVRDGTTLIMENRGDTGNSVVCHFVFSVQIAMPAATSKTITVYLVRAGGTATASFDGAAEHNNLNAVFIPN